LFAIKRLKLSTNTLAFTTQPVNSKVRHKDFDLGQIFWAYYTYNESEREILERAFSAAGKRNESHRPHASRALSKRLELALLPPRITFLTVTIGKSNWQHIFYYFLNFFLVSTWFFPILINRKPRIVRSKHLTMLMDDMKPHYPKLLNQFFD